MLTFDWDDEDMKQIAVHGGLRCSSCSHLFVQECGGGIDFHVSKHFNMRVADGDYPRWTSFPPQG